MQLLSITNSKIFAFAILILSSVWILRAQSSDQYYPTPITSNEITGTIKARDVGDARLTTYYYAFNGTQGDIFINVVSRNFNGDIDIYLLDGLKPLTKMVIYADDGTYETGRLLYLRKPEKLMLRIEGRTPGDESATYRIKFGGSFSPLSSKTRDGAQSAPKISNSDDTRVRVNSVGTIIPVPVVPAGTATNQKSDKTTNAKPETSEKAGDIDAAKTDQAVKPEITISEKPESSDSSKTTVADSK